MKAPLPDAVKNAAIRYRAILRNNEVGTDPNSRERREWDDRVGQAEIALEEALIASHMMTSDDAIERITVEGRDVRVVFEVAGPITLHA